MASKKNYDFPFISKGKVNKNFDKEAEGIRGQAHQQNISWRKWVFWLIFVAFVITFFSSIVIIFLAVFGVSAIKGGDLQVVIVALSSKTFFLVYLITKYLFSHNLFR